MKFDKTVDSILENFGQDVIATQVAMNKQLTHNLMSDPKKILELIYKTPGMYGDLLAGRMDQLTQKFKQFGVDAQQISNQIEQARKLVEREKAGQHVPVKRALPVNENTNTVNKITVSDNGATINLNSDILFGFDNKDISPEGSAIVANLAKKIAEISPQLKSKHQIIVTGNTDLYEIRPGYNDRLSKERAQSVASSLQRVLGGNNLPINVQGVGSRNPIVKDLPFPIEGNKAPEQGKAQQAPNRRVTITFNPPLPQPIQQTITQDIPKMTIVSEPVSKQPRRRTWDWIDTSRSPRGELRYPPLRTHRGEGNTWREREKARSGGSIVY